MLISLVRLAIQELRASGNLRRWMRLVSGAVDSIVVGAAPGVVFEIRFPLELTTAQSVQEMPDGSIINSAELEVNTAYSPGTTITIGSNGQLAAFMGAADNTPTVIGLYQVPQDTGIGLAFSTPVIATVAGAPVVGAGFVIVRYSVPFV